jgi:quercetin dioxygenase-like cupin family protein
MNNTIRLDRNQRTGTGGIRHACVATKATDSKQPPVALDPRIRFGPGGGVYRIVTTAQESAGRIFAFEATEPPGGGPPLHTHATEEEYFFVLEGEMSFYIDGKVIVRKAGESAFVPRGAAHCFKNCSTRESRVLVLFTPGNIEGFFDYGLPIDGQVPSDKQLIARLGELGPKYNLTLIGPSPL